MRLEIRKTFSAFTDDWGYDGTFTGNWIFRYIPSIAIPNVSIPEFNRVMIDNYTDGTNKPVLA